MTLYVSTTVTVTSATGAQELALVVKDLLFGSNELLRLAEVARVEGLDVVVRDLLFGSNELT